MKVAIVGGGIGGMALALALLDAGIGDVDIYESASTIRELGVGINVLPHAARELTELGLLDDLLAAGIPAAEYVLYSTYGQRIWGEPRGLATGYHWPQISIHRGELLGVLHRAVCRRLGPDQVHVGHHLVHFDQRTGDTVRAEFADRDTSAPRGHAAAKLKTFHEDLTPDEQRALNSALRQPGTLRDEAPEGAVGYLTTTAMALTATRAVDVANAEPQAALYRTHHARGGSNHDRAHRTDNDRAGPGPRPDSDR